MSGKYSIVSINSRNIVNYDDILDWVKSNHLDLEHVGFSINPRELKFYFLNDRDAASFKLAWL